MLRPLSTEWKIKDLLFKFYLYDQYEVIFVCATILNEWLKMSNLKFRKQICYFAWQKQNYFDQKSIIQSSAKTNLAFKTKWQISKISIKKKSE